MSSQANASPLHWPARQPRARHETRGALTIPYSPGAPPWHRRLLGNRDAVSDRTGCATVFDIAGPAPACMVREMGRPRRGERRAGAFCPGGAVGGALRTDKAAEVAGSIPAPATNYLQGLQGLRARVLDAERCSDSPLCMVAGDGHGTADCVRRAKEAGIEVLVIRAAKEAKSA